MTQSEQILKHLQKGKAITPLEASELVQCLRLAARVSDIKAQIKDSGFTIESKMVKKNGKCFASYSLAKAA